MGTAGEVQTYNLGIRLSPDATRVAMAHAQSGNTDVWIYEFARGVSTRFTFDPASDTGPVWSPDGSRIAFSSNRGGKWAFYQKAANGAGAEELLFTPEGSGNSQPSEWSRDGRFLLFYVGGLNSDSFAVPLTGSPADRKAIPIVAGQFNERGARMSPDGRWFSYTSNETGKDEAYVRPFDPASGKSAGGQFMISKNGGTSPHWRGDGREMYYQSPDGTIVSVDITTTPVFQAGAPTPLFKGPAGVIFWDVTADGKRFLIPVPQNANSPTPYRVVLNWTSTLKK
jgi:Tol biopolymer transport system component